MTQIDAIQKKFLAKLEQKCVGNKSLTSVLRKAFRDVDLDNDGVISFPEWARVVEVAGSVLTDQESEFLFYFWDSMAGQREPQGLISVAVATNDLMARRAIHRRAIRHAVGRAIRRAIRRAVRRAICRAQRSDGPSTTSTQGTDSAEAIKTSAVAEVVPEEKKEEEKAEESA